MITDKSQHPTVVKPTGMDDVGSKLFGIFIQFCEIRR